MIVELIVFSIAFLIAIPLLIIATECLIVLFFSKWPLSAPVNTQHSYPYKILVPAHDEAEIIKQSLTKLIAELPDSNPKNIVLVADNCTDKTANIAKSLGVTVLERQNASQRGKGFALDFGIQYLAKNGHPEVLVFLDADCETSKTSLITLINTVGTLKQPGQMTNIMRVIKQANIKQKIAGFAWMLKNKVRPLALSTLRLPVILTGTGMAIPWEVFDKVKLGHGNIVEDMQLGIDCAINGYRPVLCADAVVYSDFPEQSTAERNQRTRWEHGHLQTILQQVPSLIKESWRQKNLRLLAFALDIGVPPLSLLVLITVSSLVLLAIYSLIAGSGSAFTVLLLSFMYFAVMLGLIWQRFGKDYLTVNELAGIPRYIFSKLSIYVSFIFKRQKEWIRTDRDY